VLWVDIKVTVNIKVKPQVLWFNIKDKAQVLWFNIKVNINLRCFGLILRLWSRV